MSSSAQSVLVVEDEASIASFVSLYLKNAGYEVRTATNGTEALISVQRDGQASDALARTANEAPSRIARWFAFFFGAR